MLAEYLTKNTQVIFDRVMNQKSTDPHVVKAFIENNLIWESLELLRKNRCLD